jgi:phosphoenolpyruvate carboxylase
MTRAHDDLLQRDERRLAALLDDVIGRLAGPDALALVAEIRDLARDRRAGHPQAERALAGLIESLDEERAGLVARAFSVYFDLVNIAEDRQRVRVLRERERARHPEPVGESIAAAVAESAGHGLTAEEMAAALRRLRIELVFTAHPSEAKRRSIRAKLRRMRHALEQLDRPDLLPRERARHEADLRSELTVIWETDFLRPARPTVLDEVERGLSIMPRIWEAVPQVHAALRQSLAEHYPDSLFDPPAFLRFGSWMGGDRDGNPFVTADVTARTLVRLRQAAIDQHLAWCTRLYDLLTVSLAAAGGGRPLAERLTERVAEWPGLAAALEPLSAQEIYRRWIVMIRFRLEAARMVSLDRSAMLPSAYRSGPDLEADVALMVECLEHDLGHASTADTPARRWLDLVRAFGLHMTALDVRQESRAYLEIMGDVLTATGVLPHAAAYESLDPQARAELLTTTLGGAAPAPGAATSDGSFRLRPLAADTLALFEVLHRAVVRFGPECLGCAIVSLTRTPADVLAVLWLWRWAQARAAAAGEPVADGDPAIVPLFEKIHDLAVAHDTLAAILDQPCWRSHLQGRDGRQVVMIGYSDSTKDGGYLAACWGLQAAQERLHEVAAARGVRLTFFHGRGGSLGRGGGPAARGILSLPAGSLDGTLRLTEQGEVLAERYDDVEIARRHLEQVAWATLMGSTTRRPPTEVAWTALATRLAKKSETAYRALVDEPGFIEYFAQTTPIDEIENLPIASRPARRRGQRTLDDLRAIPWVFAWTQSRCMIPAWYGLGAALAEVKYEDRTAWQLVCEMYREWPFFRATIDNATLALAKADMYVACRYAELAEDGDVRRRIWPRIAEERDRTRQAILDIAGGGELLAGTPWFRASIEARNPSVDPLNLVQIEFMRRQRAALAGEATPDTASPPFRNLLRLCLQGIAAGMRTTG